MSRKWLGVVCLALGSLAGCANYDVQPAHVAALYDPAEVAWSKAEGTNRIEGSALLRTQGGEVRTCAAFEVQLIPAAAYATERMMVRYLNPTRGFIRSLNVRPFNDPAQYHADTRITICDAQGMFAFDKLPDGKYYIETTVDWSAYDSTLGFTLRQGGLLMQQVELSGGETERVVLTN